MCVCVCVCVGDMSRFNEADNMLTGQVTTSGHALYRHERSLRHRHRGVLGLMRWAVVWAVVVVLMVSHVGGQTPPAEITPTTTVIDDFGTGLGDNHSGMQEYMCRRHDF